MQNFEYDQSLLDFEESLKVINQEIQNRLSQGCQANSLSNDLVAELSDFYDSGTLKFALGDSADFEDALGGVDLNDPTLIYLTEKFFFEDEEEQIRTVIHEITHVLGWTHPDSKTSPEYFKSPALQAEKCLTGIATFKSKKTATCVIGNGYRLIKP